MPVHAIAAYAYRKSPKNRGIADYIAKQKCISSGEEFDAVKAKLDRLFGIESKPRRIEQSTSTNENAGSKVAP